MKLKDARTLKSQYRQQIAELQDKRSDISLVRMEPGENWEDYLLPEERVDLLTRDIDELTEKYLKLSALIRRANNTTVGSPIPAVTGSSISDLLEEAILLRQEADCCKRLGRNRPRTRTTTNSERGTLIEQATYDIPAMAQRARELEQKAQDLSARVDVYDLQLEIEA